MEVLLNYRSFEVDGEPRMYRQGDMPTLPGQVSPEGLEPDEYGRIVVPQCTFVDKDGKVCKLSKSGFEGEPIGMTHDTKVLQPGGQPKSVALWVRGHFKASKLQFEDEEYSDEIGQVVETYFPEMHIYPNPGTKRTMNVNVEEKIEVVEVKK